MTKVYGSVLPTRYDRTAAEIAASVVPVNTQYEPGNVLRYGMVGDGGTTDNTTAFQNALNANAGINTIIIPRGTGYYKLTGKITAPADTHIIFQNGATLYWTATTNNGSNFLGTATRPGIEVLGNNFRMEGRGTFKGPSAGTYVVNEVGIYMLGTSTAARKSGLYIEGNIEFLNWGSYGILPMFVDDVHIIGTHIHDCGYIGIVPMSCRHGKIQRNTIHDMTPGTSSEAHGISLSNDSTSYNTDPNASSNGRLHANPFNIDFDIAFNTVYDIPLWTGIDAHACYDTHVHDNKVYNCKRLIQIANGGSGAAGPYAGEGNSVCNNTITSRKRDGSASTVSGYKAGIVVNGGSTVLQRDIRVIGNDIEGCGDFASGVYSIEATYVAQAVITNNVIRNWSGIGIYSSQGDGIIKDNVFGALSSAANSTVIRIDTTTSGAWTIDGNRHRPISGTTANEGLRVGTSNPKIVLGPNNDFDIATTPYINIDGARVRPRKFYGGLALERQVQVYSASMTIDTSLGNEFDITASNTSAFTINAPTNAVDGQILVITLRNTSGGALGTATWNAIFKMSTWTNPANGFNRSISFRYDGTNWVQINQTGVDVPN